MDSSELSPLLFAPHVDVGDLCIIRGNNRAVIFTGQPLFWCCVNWGFESFVVPDGSYAEIVEVDPMNNSITTVRILKSPNIAIENVVGMMKANFLVKAENADSFNDPFHSILLHSQSSPIINVQDEEFGFNKSLDITEDDVSELMLDIDTPPAILTNEQEMVDRCDEKREDNIPFADLSSTVSNSILIKQAHEEKERRKKKQLQNQENKSNKKHLNRSLSQPVIHKSPMLAPLGINKSGKSPSLNPQNFKLHLPDGDLSLKDVMEIVPYFEKGSMSYSAMYPILLDRKARSMKGEVFRAVTNLIKTDRFKKLRFLNSLKDCITDIKCNGKDKLTMYFNYGSGNSASVTSPILEKYALESGIQNDPYLVHPSNKTHFVTSEPRKFIMRDQISFMISRKGIEGVFEGDVCLKAYFKFNANIQIIHNVPRIDLDNKKRPYLILGKDEKPIVHNKHYQPLIYEDWLIVSVLGQEQWIGLPPLGSNQ